MSRFRKKPVVIEAFQVPEDWILGSFEAWLHSLNTQTVTDWSANGEVIEIETLEGTMLARPGDWIICGVKGELYPCKPDIFEAIYEAVEP